MRLSRGIAVATLLLDLGAPLLARADGLTKQQCVASNEQGQQLRRAEKLRAARTQLVACLDSACPKAVREDCAQRLAEIDQAMPTIVFGAKDAARNDIATVRVEMDGQAFAERLDGTPIPVDPGEHRFVFISEGKRTLERTLVLRERDRGRREDIVLETEPIAHPAAPVPEAAPPTSVAPASSAQATEPAPPVHANIAPLVFVAGAVAIVGLGVGIGAGLASASSHSGLEKNCDGSACPPSEQGDINSFHSLRTFSTVGYVVGALGIAGGIATYLLTPHPHLAASTALVLGPGAAALRGTF